MRPVWTDEDLSLSFVRDDDELRLEFGRQLAGYVRRHRERWDITAVLEPVQLLGSKTGEVNVHLHRNPPGQLAVTIQFSSSLPGHKRQHAASERVTEVLRPGHHDWLARRVGTARDDDARVRRPRREPAMSVPLCRGRVLAQVVLVLADAGCYQRARVVVDRGADSCQGSLADPGSGDRIAAGPPGAAGRTQAA
jgi:hypothetical protein